jgi:uncharacterized protein YjiS (DUF1127 family)
MAPVFNQLPLAWIGLLGFPVMQIGRFIAGVIGRFAAELRYRRAVRDLRQLDGRMLADIGLVRSAIEAAVRGDAAAERPGYVKDRVTEGGLLPCARSGMRASRRIRTGNFAPAEANGVRYLSIPVKFKNAQAASA